eukprot:scaffold76011_cov45-Prasinocladus_malaysianus.AAC.2
MAAERFMLFKPLLRPGRELTDITDDLRLVPACTCVADGFWPVWLDGTPKLASCSACSPALSMHTVVGTEALGEASSGLDDRPVLAPKTPAGPQAMSSALPRAGRAGS